MILKTFNVIISVSEYFIPFNKTGTNLTKTNIHYHDNVLYCTQKALELHVVFTVVSLTDSCMVTMPPHSGDAQQVLTKPHKLQVQQSHLGLVFSITCTVVTAIIMCHSLYTHTHTQAYLYNRVD